MRNILITFLFLIFLIAIPQLSCKRRSAQTGYGGAVTVTAYTVETKKINAYEKYPGTIVALNEVDIRGQVTGYLTGIFFREGTQVKKGDKLYEIDRRKYKAAYDQAIANESIAESNLEKARRDADRYAVLNEQNAIAKQIFDDATTYLQNAKMQLAAAKAALQNAETDYNYSLILAPFSGTIGLSLVKTGALVNAGQTLLNTISSDDPMGVDFIINEKSIKDFVELQKHNAPDSTFKILLPDNTPYGLNGSISVIDRAVNPQTATIRVRLVFPNPQRILRAGMTCVVQVLSGGSGERMVIPAKAVVEQMGEYFVFRIDSSKVSQTRIVPGTNVGDYLVVNGGLSTGDKIVLDGLQKVRNGSMVRVGGPANN
jgi:RND family efflux transporter MFP subunit